MGEQIPTWVISPRLGPVSIIIHSRKSTLKKEKEEKKLREKKIGRERQRRSRNLTS